MRHTVKNWLNNHFGITKREYNGLLVLMGLWFAVTVAPDVFEAFAPADVAMTTANEKNMQQLEWQMEHAEALPMGSSPAGRMLNGRFADGRFAEGRSMDLRSAGAKRKLELFTFDPNLITAADWQRLGLSARQAAVLINYRLKGGRFYKAADLKRIFVISPQHYAQLEPYVRIASSSGTQATSFHAAREPRKEKEWPLVNINLADTTQLEQLKGIGPAFARRIIQYRDRLGGFYKKEQLLEVYGLDSVKFRAMENQLLIDRDAIRRIAVNTTTFDQLRTHPYLSYKEMNAILQYRKQHGNYAGIDDLKKVLILDAKTIERLSPYLAF